MDKSSGFRLSVGVKVAICAIVFAAPIIFLTLAYTKTRQEAIDFANWELKGNAYMRPLSRLLTDVERHQLALQSCAGIADCPGKRKELAAKVDANFAKLAEANQKYAADLEFTNEGLAKRGRQTATVALASQAWTAIKSAADGVGLDGNVPSKLNDQYAALQVTLRTIVTHAGDTSKLILDPDLDSYYEMDVTLLAVPQALDRLPDVAVVGRNLLTKLAADPAAGIAHESRIQMAVFAATMDEADAARIKASQETALTEDPNFYGASPTFAPALRPKLAAYLAAAAAFSDAARKIGANNTSGMTPESFVASGLAAHDAALALQEVAIDELDKLLELRIKDYVARRDADLVGSAIALLLALALSFYFARSITKPLVRLVGSLGPGATLLAQCATKVGEVTSKEKPDPELLGIIVEELTAHAQEMNKAVAELTAHVKGRAGT